MNRNEIVQRRLHNQQITRHAFERPEEVVEWLGAVQAQDYPSAKWAVGQRLDGATDSGIEQAFAEGAILRTHVLRPTWHFVTPGDIRWMLALTSPRVNAANSHYYRQHGLDERVFARGNDAIAKALEGGKQLTRPELVAALKQAGIVRESLGSLFLVMRAELDGVICSGARRGKQFTYALLDERATHSQARRLERDEALAELARRYFTSRGPATLRDFAWWSGLTTVEARVGLEAVRSEFMEEVVDGQSYWFAPSAQPVRAAPRTAYLLPNYDEYTVGYSDRSAVFDASHVGKAEDAARVVLGNVVVIDGQVAGSWKRTLRKNEVEVEVAPFAPLSEEERRAVSEAAERYGRFLGMGVATKVVDGKA